MRETSKKVQLWLHHWSKRHALALRWINGVLLSCVRVALMAQVIVSATNALSGGADRPIHVAGAFLAASLLLATCRR